MTMMKKEKFTKGEMENKLYLIKKGKVKAFKKKIYKRTL